MRDLAGTKEEKGFERLQDLCLNNRDFHKKAESSDEMFGKTGEKRSAWRPDIFYLCFSMKFMQRFYDEQLGRLPSNFSYHSEK